MTLTREDLTVREVEEAESYGLTLDQYLELKAKFNAVALQKTRDQVAKEYRDERLEQEIRPRLKTEITNELRKSIEEELGEKMFQRARETLLADKSSPKERAAIRNFAREIEIDALTYARTASTVADRSEWALAWQMRFLRPLFHALWLSFGPIAYWIYSHHGLNFALFAAVVIPWFLAFCVLGGFNSELRKAHNATITLSRKKASEYWRVAEQAKRLHMVDAHLDLSRREIREKLEHLVTHKESVDQDFTPDATTLDDSRKKIREMLLTESDTSDFLRVDTKEPEKTPSDDGDFEEEEVSGPVRAQNG